MHKKYGFTIVELLIVIVVIAILAAISVVAYRGVQARAMNSRVVASFDVAEKALRMYFIENGCYPLTMDSEGGILQPGNAQVVFACIGDPADYPANAYFAAGECYKSNLEGNYAVNSPAINAQINTVVSGFRVSTENAMIDEAEGSGFRGLMYQAWEDNGSVAAHLMLMQAGDRECGRGFKEYDPDSHGIEGMTICGVELSTIQSR